MKLTLLQKDFAQKLTIVNRFVSSRAQLPILSNLKLKTDKSKLLIYATNLEMSICMKLGANTEADGEITLPARVLHDLVASIASDQIMIESVGENVKIVSEESSSSLSGMNTSDFPTIPDTVVGETIEINATEFSKALASVLYSASLDDTRPALAGILFIFKGNTLSLVSSDGFRLSKFDITSDTNFPESKVILPKHAISEVGKLITNLDKNITFSLDVENNQVVFDLGDAIISSRVIEGEYPTFEKIIPHSFAVKVNIDRETFLKHIKSAAVFAREGSSIINLSVEESEVVITAESSRIGSHMSRINAKVEGESASINFNYRYIEEFLNAVKGDDIILELTNSSSAGVFKDSKLTNYLHLIMPVRS